MRQGEFEEGGQKKQVSIYEINKHFTAAKYVGVFKTVDPEVPSQGEFFFLFFLSNLFEIMVII